jgi:hypothetical protein
MIVLNWRGAGALAVGTAVAAKAAAAPPCINPRLENARRIAS